MLRNYLKQTWRSLVKNKTYSLLNIIGLSAGLTCFAFIALWVKDEWSYDKFNTNYDRIYRLAGTVKTESSVMQSAVSSAPMGPALKNDYPEVENMVRVDLREEIVRHKGEQILQGGIILTDPSFFDIFSYKLTHGDKATALKEPYSLILTESAAKKYFGNSDPMGQTLTINMADTGVNGATYTVKGLIADPPKNAHFTFEILASFKTLEGPGSELLTIDGWGDASFYTYLLLKKGVDYRAFSERISQFYGKYIGERFDIWKSHYFYHLQPLSDIHLRSKLENEITATGNITQVYIFLTIGIFILLLAGINYMNLATARSVNRAKETGIKKVVGALKKQLVAQYLFEAVLTALIALAASLVFCFLLQPLFTQITGKDLSPLSSPALIAFLTGVTVLLGVISGIYPALVISAFKPASVLKGSFKTGTRGVILRKSLVVAQFTITLVLITGIIVIYSQMAFIKNKDLGYNKDALLFLRVHGNTNVITGYEAFKNDLSSSPWIGGITSSNSLLANGLGTGGSETVDAAGKPLQVNTARLRVDADYFNVYKIKLVAGRDFTTSSLKDTIRQIIINESAVKKFGWPNAEFAIGKSFRIGGQSGEIRAVAGDFHFNSLQETILPIAIYPLADRFSRITVNINTGKASEAIAWIEKTWKKHFPATLLDYDFLDKVIGDQYRAEQRFSKIFSYFSILSLLIACLGLYGLIAFATSQKTKEIGIRKVLGASVNGIALMLSKDFLKLVVIAFLIAAPVAGFIMNNWLQDFAYRINISWWMFAAAGIAVLLIAIVTVSFKAIRAAIANPVKSLRTE